MVIPWLLKESGFLCHVDESEVRENEIVCDLVRCDMAGVKVVLGLLKGELLLTAVELNVWCVCL